MRPLAEQVIEGARAGLRGLADVVAGEIDEAWRRVPLKLGVAGDHAARGALLARLSDGLLEDSPREPGWAAICLRRGAVTRFHAWRDDGDEVEEMPAGGGDPRERAAAAAADGVVTARAEAVALAEAELPALVRTPPPRWKLWLWPVRWVRALLARRQLTAWRRAVAELDAARAQRRQIAGSADADDDRTRLARDRFVERLHTVAQGGARVREVELEIAADTIPDGVEVLELTGWSRAGATVDAVVEAPPAGEPATAMTDLPTLLRDARALSLGRRAQRVIAAELGRIDDKLAAVAAAHADRIAAIEALRVRDRDAFVAAQLVRTGTQFVASIRAVIEHASAHLGSELAALGGSWNQRIATASSTQEVGAAATSIEEDIVTSAQRIHDEVTMLATGGLGGIVHDLMPTVLAPLAAHGLSDQELAKVPRTRLPPVTMLASLTELSTGRLGTGRLAAMLRSVDGVKQELHDKAAQRADRLRAQASAEMLDSEPHLRAALETAFAATLHTALDHADRRLDERLAAERAAIDTERAALAGRVAARVASHAAAATLTAALAALESADPAASAACAAAAAL